MAYFKELTYPDARRSTTSSTTPGSSSKGKTVAELTAQWNPEYWRALFEDEVKDFDQLIEAFNQQAGC